MHALMHKNIVKASITRMCNAPKAYNPNNNKVGNKKSAIEICIKYFSKCPKYLLFADEVSSNLCYF